MIYNTAGVQILSSTFAVRNLTDESLTIRIDCETGYSLSSQATADAAVEVRRVGDVPWVNLETTPISLTPWDGTQQDFEIRVTAGTITSFMRRYIPIRVSK